MATKTKAAVRGKGGAMSVETASGPVSSAEIFTLDGPPRATDWLTIGRCALERLQVDLGQLLEEGNPRQQEDSAERLVAMAVEQLEASRLTPVSSAYQAAECLDKIDLLIEAANAVALKGGVSNGKWLMELIIRDIRNAIEAMYAAEKHYKETTEAICIRPADGGHAA